MLTARRFGVIVGLLVFLLYAGMDIERAHVGVGNLRTGLQQTSEGKIIQTVELSSSAIFFKEG